MRSANTLLSLLSVLGAAQHALGQFSTRLGGVNTAGYDFSVGYSGVYPHDWTGGHQARFLQSFQIPQDTF